MVCEQDRESGIRAELKVNGLEIELNNFIQDFLGRAVIGMVGSLRGVDKVQNLTLSVSKPIQ